ncbi:Alpha/Beta hydrolase protein [Xylaria arbuscula]|nr:Alpha/Beta hydrolase protein [Xylaria arbuscula]
MLPLPSLTFTVPSIYDGTELDCRVYHPPSSHDPSHPGVPWSGQHVAVVAHPYAPMGGCFDDPIVDITAGTLLQLGFLVATFNFRGATSGRTSWTSKPEQADYISVVGFLAYYVRHLGHSPGARHTSRHQLPIMLMAGYSYGAMVTTRLPPLDTILTYFASPALHTAEAGIRLRAQYLAEVQSPRFINPMSMPRPLDIRFSGDKDASGGNDDGSSPVSESEQAEQIRVNVQNLFARANAVNRESTHWSSQRETDNKIHPCLEEFKGDISFQSAYITVSPPVGLVTRLATLSFSNPLSSSWMRRSKPATGTVSITDETPLASNPTLIIYGQQDGFITYSKMREWTRQLSEASISQFHHVQVAGAGHFWAEGDVVYRLRDAIGTFATELTRLDSSSAPIPSTVNAARVAGREENDYAAAGNS